jgi:hypothetical protein
MTGARSAWIEGRKRALVESDVIVSRGLANGRQALKR